MKKLMPYLVISLVLLSAGSLMAGPFVTMSGSLSTGGGDAFGGADSLTLVLEFSESINTTPDNVQSDEITWSSGTIWADVTFVGHMATGASYSSGSADRAEF